MILTLFSSNKIFSSSTLLYVSLKVKKPKIQGPPVHVRLVFVAVQNSIENDRQDTGNDNSVRKEHLESCWKAIEEGAVVQTNPCSNRYSSDEEIVLIVFKINTRKNLHPLNRYKTKHDQHRSPKNWTWNDLC